MRIDKGNTRTWECDYCDKFVKQEGGRALAMPPVPPENWNAVSVARFFPAHKDAQGNKIGDALDDQRRVMCPRCAGNPKLLQSNRGVSICIDCDWHHQHSEPIPGMTCRKSGGPFHEGTPPKGFLCEHWRPETWVKEGFVRHWGDAAISELPHMEILRRDQNGIVEYVILSPYMLRRPVRIFANRGENIDPQGGELFSWGSY